MVRKPISVATSVFPMTDRDEVIIYWLITTIVCDDGSVWRRWGEQEQWEQITLPCPEDTHST